MGGLLIMHLCLIGVDENMMSSNGGLPQCFKTADIQDVDGWINGKWGMLLLAVQHQQLL